MVKKDAANNMSDAMMAYKTVLFDLPMVGTRWGLGFGNEKETTATAWTGYDAMVRLASRTVDGWYRTPLFAQTTLRSLEGFLRWQQVGNASTKTVLTGLTQAAGHLLCWRLNQIIRETGRPIIVFGHSLGGMLARFLGANFPDQVCYVVTIGSPIQRTENVSPLVLFASRVLQPFRRWRGELPAECGTMHCNCHFNHSVISPLPQEVGFTSIFSKEDQVVEWSASIDPHRENREVTGCHIGLIVNPQVYRVLADVLSRLQQKERDANLTVGSFSE